MINLADISNRPAQNVHHQKTQAHPIWLPLFLSLIKINKINLTITVRFSQLLQLDPSVAILSSILPAKLAENLIKLRRESSLLNGIMTNIEGYINYF